ncbi:MAG: glycosyltransferase [Thermofilum sp.]
MIALAMITKNSLERVKEDFAKVWESSLQIPYNVIILVDDSDNNKTREFVKKFADKYQKELIVESSRLYDWHKATRATARQTAIDVFFENTSNKWLFFLDDDFILGDGWWREAKPYTELEKVGLIWGIDYTPFWKDRIQWLNARKVSEREHAIRSFNIRGGLHDTLLRREAIEGIKLPPWLHVYEDAWIKRYVECKGYNAVVIDVPNIHLRSDASGYSKNDIEIAIKVSALLNLEKISFSTLLKTLFGLPGYMYYSYRSHHSMSKGYLIWKDRLTYRAKLFFTKKTKDPCSVVISSNLSLKL